MQITGSHNPSPNTQKLKHYKELKGSLCGCTIQKSYPASSDRSADKKNSLKKTKLSTQQQKEPATHGWICNMLSLFGSFLWILGSLSTCKHFTSVPNQQNMHLISITTKKQHKRKIYKPTGQKGNQRTKGQKFNLLESSWKPCKMNKRRGQSYLRMITRLVESGKCQEVLLIPKMKSRTSPPQNFALMKPSHWLLI